MMMMTEPVPSTTTATDTVRVTATEMAPAEVTGIPAREEAPWNGCGV